MSKPKNVIARSEATKQSVGRKRGRPRRDNPSPKNVIAPRNTPRRGVPSGAPANTPASTLKDGLPMHAFAIFADVDDTSTWQLPHHTKTLGSPAKDEQTVDWTLVDRAVLLISRYGIDGMRVIADPELIIQAARHLAGHYRKAGKPIPTALCVFDISE